MQKSMSLINLSVVIRQIQHVAEGEFREILVFVIESSSDEEKFDQHQEDTMPYP